MDLCSSLYWWHSHFFKNLWRPPRTCWQSTNSNLQLWNNLITCKVSFLISVTLTVLVGQKVSRLGLSTQGKNTCYYPTSRTPEYKGTLNLSRNDGPFLLLCLDSRTIIPSSKKGNQMGMESCSTKCLWAQQASSNNGSHLGLWYSRTGIQNLHSPSMINTIPQGVSFP